MKGSAMFAGFVTVGVMWFGAGYCMGYGQDHPAPAAVAVGLLGLGLTLAACWVGAAVIFIAGSTVTFPGYEERRKKALEEEDP